MSVQTVTHQTGCTTRFGSCDEQTGQTRQGQTGLTGSFHHLIRNRTGKIIVDIPSVLNTGNCTTDISLSSYHFWEHLTEKPGFLQMNPNMKKRWKQELSDDKGKWMKTIHVMQHNIPSFQIQTTIAQYITSPLQITCSSQ